MHSWRTNQLALVVFTVILSLSACSDGSPEATASARTTPSQPTTPDRLALTDDESAETVVQHAAEPSPAGEAIVVEPTPTACACPDTAPGVQRDGSPLSVGEVKVVAVATIGVLTDAGVGTIMKMPDEAGDTINIGVWSDTMSLDEIRALVTQEAVAAVQPMAGRVPDWDALVILSLGEPFSKGGPELPDAPAD